MNQKDAEKLKEKIRIGGPEDTYGYGHFISEKTLIGWIDSMTEEESVGKVVEVEKLKAAILTRLKDEIVTEEDMKELDTWIDTLAVEREPVPVGLTKEELDTLIYDAYREAERKGYAPQLFQVELVKIMIKRGIFFKEPVEREPVDTDAISRALQDLSLYLRSSNNNIEAERQNGNLKTAARQLEKLKARNG